MFSRLYKRLTSCNIAKNKVLWSLKLKRTHKGTKSVTSNRKLKLYFFRPFLQSQNRPYEKWQKQMQKRKVLRPQKILVDFEPSLSWVMLFRFCFPIPEFRFGYSLQLSFRKRKWRKKAMKSRRREELLKETQEQWKAQ